MIAHINGILMKKTTQSLIVDNDGIGYEILVPLSTFYSLPEEENRVSLHIHTHVREDAFILFGFKTLLEKEIFRMLISVSGIGPDELLEAMARGDAFRLQSIPGVGKKTAERIALELRDKAIGVRPDLEVSTVQFKTVEDKKVVDDALSALINLGYPARSAKSAVQKALSVVQDINLEGLIKEALRRLA